MSSESFIEKFIFMRYKDKCIGNAERFKGLLKKKYGNIDVCSVYIKIVNYQIKKYGGCLLTYNADRSPEGTYKHD